MKILLVHEVNYLSKITYEFQILPETLSMLGHHVTIVDFDDTWYRNDDPTFLRTRVFSGVHRAYAAASVTVRRPGMVRLPGVSRISAALTTTLELLKLVRRETFDAVLLYALPTLGFQTLLLARLFGVPVHFRSIDVLHRLVPYAPLVPITRWMEGVVYRRVDAITTITRHLERYICSFGVDPRRVLVLPSGVDIEMFSPGARDTVLLERLGIGSNDPVALFMGTLYRFSGLDRVIAGWRQVLERIPHAKLLIVGEGEAEAGLRAQVRDLALTSSVVFGGLHPYAALPAIVRSATVCLNPFELNEVTRDILPTKLFQYLACGKPVLATALPGTLPFLEGETDGVVYAELPTFTETLATLLADPLRCEQLGSAGCVSASRFAWAEIALRLVAWIESVGRQNATIPNQK